MSVTRDRIRMGDRSDKDQRKTSTNEQSNHPKLLENNCDFLRVPTSDRHSRVAFGDVLRNFQAIGQHKNMDRFRLIRKFLSLC